MLFLCSVCVQICLKSWWDLDTSCKQKANQGNSLELIKSNFLYSLPSSPPLPLPIYLCFQHSKILTSHILKVNVLVCRFSKWRWFLILHLRNDTNRIHVFWLSSIHQTPHVFSTSDSELQAETAETRARSNYVWAELKQFVSLDAWISWNEIAELKVHEAEKLEKKNIGYSCCIWYIFIYHR